jgi:hypothetical protein
VSMQETSNADLNEALSSNYLLCELQIRSWSGKATDQDATAEVIQNKQAAKDAGAFTKNLMASAGIELKAIQQKGASLRHFVYSKTLPWSASGDGVKRGARLLASSAAMDFLQEFRGYKQEYDEAVKALIAVWDLRVGQAMQNLGQLACATDYPALNDLPKKFAISIDMEPIPAMSDFTRLNVPAPLATALGNRHAAIAQQQVQNAMNEMRDRMMEELQRIDTQMSKHAAGEKTRLYDSLITNMQGLVQMAKNMNLTNNPKLTELAEKIELRLLAHPVQVYKDDPGKAAVLAHSARELATEAAMEEIWK